MGWFTKKESMDTLVEEEKTNPDSKLDMLRSKAAKMKIENAKLAAIKGAKDEIKQLQKQRYGMSAMGSMMNNFGSNARSAWKQGAPRIQSAINQVGKTVQQNQSLAPQKAMKTTEVMVKIGKNKYKKVKVPLPQTKPNWGIGIDMSNFGAPPVKRNSNPFDLRF